MRRKVKNRIIPESDFKYNSEIIGRFINYVMRNGKKTIAEKIVYTALDDLKSKSKSDDVVELFEKIIDNVGPKVEVRSRRVGGANYSVPREVRPERRVALGMRWLLEVANKKKGSEMSKRLANELLLASKNEGEAVKKRENVHKMAEANKAFAHFAW